MALLSGINRTKTMGDRMMIESFGYGGQLVREAKELAE